MRAVIEPGPLSGEIRAIASKSQAHRLLICAALADRETEIICRESSRDIDATADCLRALGTRIDYDGSAFRVRPIDVPVPDAQPDCGESGSTLRFLLPVLCALGAGARVKMHGRLPERPLSPLWEELERHGALLSRPEPDVIAVGGRMSGGEYELAGNVSSQFISGLLLALPLCGGGRITLTSAQESAAYIEMTRRAQALFGVHSAFDGAAYTVPPEARYRSPGTLGVEGDWSNAAFWLCAGALGSGVGCTNLDPASPQGDRAVSQLLGEIRRGNAVVDAREIPDLVPVLSVAAAVSPGVTEFINAGRLRIKESDRIETTAAMLRALGAEVTVRPDGLAVRGAGRLAGGAVDSANDHRIAMSAAVASTVCRGTVTVLGAQCVNKSYPAFWDDFRRLGGRVTLTEEE